MDNRLINALLIEDNPGDAYLVQEMLAEAGRGDFRLEHLSRLSEALKRLAQGGIDVVLLDLSLPDSFGLDTFFQVREQVPQVPVILLTALDDEDVAVRAMREGAQDYLLKERVEGDALVRTMRYAIERKNAAEQLRLQSKALEAAANAIVISDRKGAIIWVNPAFTRLTGYTLEEVLQQNSRLLKSGQHPPSFYKELWETILDGRVWHGELINRRKDGTLYTEEMTITPVHDWRGKITHFIAIKQDISQRKQVESALRRSEARFRELLESAPDAILSVDREGRILLVNTQVEKLFGYTQEELLGQSVELLVPERFRDIHAQHRGTYRANPQTRPMGKQLNLTARRKDGSEFPVEIGLSPAEADDGFMVTAIVHDIAARKQAEEQIVQQNEFLSTVIESLAHPFYVVNVEDYTIEMANSAARRNGSSETLTCYALSHHREQPCTDQAYPCPLDEVVKTKQPVTIEHLHYTESGGQRYFEVHGYPIFDSQGDVVQMIEYTLDVSERKRAEEALAWEAGTNAAMAELSQTLIALASLAQLSELVLQHAKNLTGSTFGFVGYIDPQTGHLISPTLTRDIWDQCLVEDKDTVFHVFSGLWGWVLENQKSLMSNAPTSDARSTGVPEGHLPIEQFVSAPALLGDTLVGIVALANPGRDYTERDLVLVERLASLYALAVQHHRSQEAIREMNVRLALVNQVSRHLSSILDLDTLLDEIVRALQGNLGYRYMGVWLVDGDECVLKTIADEGMVSLKGYRLKVGVEGVVGWVVAHKQPRRVGDIVQESHYHRLPGLPPMRSELAVPILSGDQILGVLNLESEQPNAFDEMDEALIQAVADQVALAMQNAYLFEEVKVQRDEAMAVTESLFELTDRVVSMNRVATALLASNDLDEVVTLFVESLRDEMGVQKSALWLVEEDKMRLAATVGLPSPVRSEPWGVDCLALSRVWQTGKRLTCEQLTRKTRCNACFDNWLMLPVKAQDQVLGVLVTELEALEEDTLRMFINQAALGIMMARSYRALTRTNAELARAIQAKTNLLNFMSHEVRNPLTAIIGFGKLLRRGHIGPLNEKQGLFVDRILSGSQHMADLVSAVLDLSRAESGKLDVHLEAVPISEICVDVADMISGRVEERNLNLEINLPDPHLLVSADPVRLRQILLNLLTNAVKFTPAGGTITLGAEAKYGEGGRDEIVFRVADTGIGIKEEDFPRVFGEFEQVDNDRTRSEVGSGLGLTLTKQLVELHRGRIWFTSTSGEGATFFVALAAA